MRGRCVVKGHRGVRVDILGSCVAQLSELEGEGEDACRKTAGPMIMFDYVSLVVSMGTEKVRDIPLR